MSASSTNQATTTTPQPSPSGAAASAAVGRLSKKTESGSQSRRATSSGAPSKAAKAARSAGPLACSADTAVRPWAARDSRWKARGQAAPRRPRRVEEGRAGRASDLPLGFGGGAPVRQACVAPRASTDSDRVERQSAAALPSEGPLMRIQVSAGSCAAAASPAPFKWARPPRPTRRNRASPLRRVADKGPGEKSWATDSTCPSGPPAGWLVGRIGARQPLTEQRRPGGRMGVLVSYRAGILVDSGPVSYTHLTLPTICSV
eukprot:3575858-Alexandrium_andersonii.AAC.1